MHRCVRPFVGTLIVALPLVAVADVLEIPLALTGPDNPSELETANFVIDVPMVAVSQVALRLAGSYREIMYIAAFDPFSFLWRPAFLDMYLGDDVVDAALVEERHQFPAGSGPFEFERILLSGNPDDWPFLSDGAGQIGLECGPSYTHDDNGQFFSAAGTFGTVTSATLVVTYDPSVPTVKRTWGWLRRRYQ